MQRLQVQFLASALADLESIYLYILDKSANAVVATGFTDRIVDRAEKIGDAPNGGAPRPDLGQGLRLVPFERSAVIIYRVVPETVQIINVFYGGRDYEALLHGQPDAP
jgi:toxin ParE1/3/4